MNARLADLENQILINELVSSVKDFSARKKVSLQEALDFKIAIHIKQSQREGAKAAWEQRADQARKILSL